MPEPATAPVTAAPAAPATAAPVQVEVRGLHKAFGAVEVLRGIDLDVAQGEAVVIIGPSGSGTSTLLRCLNLLEVPTGGSVLALVIDNSWSTSSDWEMRLATAGRLIGTLLSGVLYQVAGVSASLWGAVLLAALAGLSARSLPPVATPSGTSGARLNESVIACSWPW